ncbi:DUF2064 domain-containing protein [Portibacter lacus]|uniref:DUF2064 domain-containing protein n=1 Tax=Portibacter lacus TaxID=1099794 RepID=A0AA37SM06_9BACT|nr:DUF2064 domain-containing protein [Portibacter lacus]GLR16921.1 hypothetical protein GCM10007940_15360 [Portibacter lacus]
MLSNGKIALIYFSRTAETEADQKKWSVASTRAQRLSISKFLYNKTLKTLQKSNLEVLHFDESCQKGRTFGEKIGNAFKAAFDQGFEAAITIGNDCIELDVASIEKVASKLTQGYNAIGPTFRNGAYLIGLTKSSFDLERFSSLGWQSDQLENDLLQYLQDQDHSIYVLNRLRDTNHLGDFSYLAKKTSFASSLIKQLKNFLAFVKITVAEYTILLLNYDSRINLSLRAPPFRF